MPDRSKKLKTGDYVEVLVPLGKDADGNPVFEKGIVPRGSMMDEKWSDVKARAERSGRHSTTVETKGARVVPDEEGAGDVIKLRDQSGALLIIPRGDMDETSWWKHVVAASEKDSFEVATLDGEDIRTRKKPTEEGANLGAEREPERKQGVRETGTLSVDEQALEDQYGSGPSKGQPRVKVDPVTGERTVIVDPSTVKKQVYDDPSMESGGGTIGSMLRKLVGGAVEGGLPGPGEANVGGGAAGPGPLPERPDAGVAPAPQPTMLERPDAGAPAPIERPDAGLSSPPPDSSSGPMPDMGFGSPSPLTNPVDLAVASRLPQASGSPPMSGQPPLATQPPAPAPAPVAPPTSTSAGLKVSGRTGPSGGPGPISRLDKAEQDFIAAQRGAAANAEKGASEQLRARADHEAKVKAFEAEQVGARLRQRETEDRINQAYLSTLDEMTKKQQIDPDHFWSSKSVGQKAFMAIGGFLAGLGGRDPSGRLDQMIQQDIAVQRENFNLAKESGRLKLAGLDTVYGRMRQRGLDDREAAAAARASMNDALANRLTSISEQMAPGEAKAKADMAIAQFRMNKVKAEDDLKNSASERWAREEELRLKKYSLEVKATEDMAKAANEKKGMQATLSKELQGLVDQRAALLQMKEASSGGFIKRGAISAASSVPGLKAVPGLSDLAAKQRVYSTRRAEFLKAIYGAVTNADYESAQQSFPPKIQAWEDPDPYFDEMLQFVDQQIARRQEAYGSAKPDERGPSAGGQGGAR